jgi:thymidine phosphorylase
MSGLSPAEFIRRKRNDEPLAQADIREFVQGIGSGTVSEGQIAAFAMASFLNGMSSTETAALTLAMRDSGDVVDWADTAIASSVIIDKHSSGGTGDEKVSLILAPLVAACGVRMPMISARGLGHTGGEVDLMEAIPGCDIAPPADVFKRAVETAGAAIIGPTGRLAPADAAIYYVRDVTATVESVPLITSSILSKKLAAGISGLVMSVNFGSGAFMPTIADAEQLSSSLIAVARQAGLQMVTLIADMDEVMGDSVGSRLQVLEAIRFLNGTHRDPRMLKLVMALSIEILLLAKLAVDEQEARQMLQQRLDAGEALQRFGKMVASLGGPSDLVDAPDVYLETASYVMPVAADATGYITKVDAFQIGLAMVGLGAGRRLPTDSIDHGVGLTGMRHLGDAIVAGDPLCLVHARDAAAYATAADAIRRAITTTPERPAENAVVTGRMSTNDPEN